MKKALMYVIPSFLLGTIVSGSIAVAATNYVQALKENASVTVNNTGKIQGSALVYNNSTYSQLYAVQQSFKSQGITTQWDGKTFNILDPSLFSSTSVHLNGVDFCSDGTDPVQNTTSPFVYNRVIDEIPVDITGFYTVITLSNIQPGHHTIETDIFDSNGTKIAALPDQFDATSSDYSRYLDYHWSNMKLATGNMVVKVNVDGNYLGSGALWVNPSGTQQTKPAVHRSSANY